jgi:hypothetical protein
MSFAHARPEGPHDGHVPVDTDGHQRVGAYLKQNRLGVKGNNFTSLGKKGRNLNFVKSE